MIKLYVGVCRGAGRQLLVARRRGGSITYEHCWDGSPDDLEELAFAMLTRHLEDGDRAQSLSANFVRLMSGRLGGDFWTFRPAEIDEAIALLT